MYIIGAGGCNLARPRIKLGPGGIERLIGLELAFQRRERIERGFKRAGIGQSHGSIEGDNRGRRERIERVVKPQNLGPVGCLAA